MEIAYSNSITVLFYWTFMLDWTRTKKSKYRQWKWSLISVIKVGFGGEHLAQRTGPFSYPSLATRLQKGVDKDGGPTLKRIGS